MRLPNRADKRQKNGDKWPFPVIGRCELPFPAIDLVRMTAREEGQALCFFLFAVGSSSLSS